MLDEDNTQWLKDYEEHLKREMLLDQAAWLLALLSAGRPEERDDVL